MVFLVYFMKKKTCGLANTPKNLGLPNLKIDVGGFF